MTLSQTRTRTTKALAGIELPACWAQSTCAAAANAYERTTKSARVSRRRLNDKVSKIQATEVAFGSWRCNCTMLAATLGEIPSRCPAHGVTLLGAPSLEANPHGVALGLTPDHRLAAAEVLP